MCSVRPRSLIAACVTVMLLLASCTTYRGSVRTAKVGGIILAAGLVVTAGVLVASSAAKDDNEQPTGFFNPALFLLMLLPLSAGMMIGGSGLAGMAIHSGGSRKPAASDDEVRGTLRPPDPDATPDVENPTPSPTPDAANPTPSPTP